MKINLIRFVFILIVFVFLGCTKRTQKEIVNSLSCSIEWGSGKLKDSDCELDSAADGSPTQLTFNILPWNPKTQNIYIRFRVRKADSLEGLKFIFSQSDKSLYSYEMPLFKDTFFNLVQDDFYTTLSFPLSALKLENTATTSLVDTVRVYIKGRAGHQTMIKISGYQLKEKTNKIGITTITFDDGYTSNYEAAQMMKVYNMFGTAYLIPEAIGKPEYLDKKSIQTMKMMGWDISSHHQSPITEFYGDDLEKILKGVVQKMSKLSDDRSSSLHFAYPLGKHSKKTMAQIKAIFKSARLASGGIESLPVSDKYRLRVINVLESSSPESLLSQAKKAKDNGDWAIFMFHYLGHPKMGDLNYSKENFKKFLKLLSKEQITVKKITEIL